MKNLMLFSPFLAFALINTAHASCYCPQGALSNGLCYIPHGQSQTMRPIGYAVCQGSSPSQPKRTYIPQVDYQKNCQPTKDGGQACSLYVDNRISFTDFTDKNGKLTFRRFYYQDNRGIVKSESTYHGENNLHGKTVHYYDNGQPQYVLNFVNGKAQGEEHQYDPNGKLKAIIYYLDGEFHGQFRYFDDNGQLIRTETFDKGKKTHSQEYLNGKKHGQELFYETDKQGESRAVKKVMWQQGMPTS